MRGQDEVDTLLGKVIRGEDGLYRVLYRERMVLWIPVDERVLQARWIV